MCIRDRVKGEGERGKWSNQCFGSIWVLCRSGSSQKYKCGSGCWTLCAWLNFLNIFQPPLLKSLQGLRCQGERRFWIRILHPEVGTLWTFFITYFTPNLFDTVPNLSDNELKGTVSRDFLSPVFFIKQLLLVPIDMPRNDFEFFRIFVEIFEFVIDSPGSRLESLK